MATPIQQSDVSQSLPDPDALDEVVPVEPPPPPEPELTEEELRFQALKDEGLDAMLMRDYDAALEAFEAAERLIPGDPAVLRNIERLHLKRGD